MLTDSFGRKINYLRVSVTDRCNLACSYCAPKHNFIKIPRESILSLEETAKIVGEAVDLGFTKVRVTGGEPLLRRNIESLISTVANMQKIEDLALTTNGILLKDHAKSLKSAGLKRVNVSLDVMDAELYKNITGGGDINLVLKGIESAKEFGLDPIKINCVVLPGVGEKERDKVRQFCAGHGLDLQFIAYMNVEGGAAVSQNIPWAQRPPLCKTCNKIRLTADGKIFPCLFSPTAVIIKEEVSIREAILKAVGLKVEKGYSFPHQAMAQIGG